MAYFILAMGALEIFCGLVLLFTKGDPIIAAAVLGFGVFFIAASIVSSIRGD